MLLKFEKIPMRCPWVFVLIALLTVPAWAADDNFGRVTKVEGKVQISRRFKKVIPKPDAKLLEKDLVKTQENSSLDIAIDEDNNLHIGPKSRMKLMREKKSDDDDEEIIIELMAGTLRSKLDDLKGQSFQVRSPVAVAGVRGTDFVSSYQPDLGPQAFALTVIEGSVDVSVIDAATKAIGQATSVQPSQKIQVSSTGQVSVVQVPAQEMAALKRRAPIRSKKVKSTPKSNGGKGAGKKKDNKKDNKKEEKKEERNEDRKDESEKEESEKDESEKRNEEKGKKETVKEEGNDKKKDSEEKNSDAPKDDASKKEQRKEEPSNGQPETTPDSSRDDDSADASTVETTQESDGGTTDGSTTAPLQVSTVDSSEVGTDKLDVSGELGGDLGSDLTESAQANAGETVSQVTDSAIQESVTAQTQEVVQQVVEEQVQTVVDEQIQQVIDEVQNEIQRRQLNVDFHFEF